MKRNVRKSICKKKSEVVRSRRKYNYKIDGFVMSVANTPAFEISSSGVERIDKMLCAVITRELMSKIKADIGGD